MDINRSDIFWSYIATILKIGSSIVLIPFVLKMIPSETVGIWTIYLTINAFAMLLDFGFNPTFTRNVTYIFSGVRRLKVTGFESVNGTENPIDYYLLRKLIGAMRWIYLRIAVLHFTLLSTAGTFYLYSILDGYSGSVSEAYISWSLLVMINTYSIYSLYYEALLLGKGLVKRSKQIVIIGQLCYLVVAVFLLYLGYGLIAVVAAQAVSVIIVRVLSYRSFFTPSLKARIGSFEGDNFQETLRTLYPNAFKIGLTSFGGFLIQRSSIIIGSLYLSLNEIASFGITVQIVSVIAGLAAVFTNAHQPKITSLQVSGNKDEIKSIYLKGQIIIAITFIFGGGLLYFFGQDCLSLIKSQTPLMIRPLIALCLFLNFEQTNLSVAGSILLTKNIVPFFRASIISGIAIVLGLFLVFNIHSFGLVTLLIVPLIIDISYQAWKWPMEVISDLNIKRRDVSKSFTDLLNMILR
jgi:O-antigen/teichoic acid export membrane protein